MRSHPKTNMDNCGALVCFTILITNCAARSLILRILTDFRAHRPNCLIMYYLALLACCLVAWVSDTECDQLSTTPLGPYTTRKYPASHIKGKRGNFEHHGSKIEAKLLAGVMRRDKK